MYFQVGTADGYRAPQLAGNSVPPVWIEFAAGHEHRGSAQVAGGFGDRDRHLAAGDAHAQGPGVGAVVGERGYGRRDRSGAA